MNQKNLSVKNKIHKSIFNTLKDKKLFKLFKKFEDSIDLRDKFAVAVSGGPDSLCLAFLSKCFAIKNNLSVKYFIVDHGLRKDSSFEAQNVKKNLKKIGINCKTLRWHGNKPSRNIQSIARDKRYLLLINECKKYNIKSLLLGHHLDDLLENFLIRLLRGSGLNGLISLSKSTKYRSGKIKILRPLLDQEKKDLIYVSKKVFKFYVKDPSNKNENFKRIRIRNLMNTLKKEGLDKKKFLLTINNLKDTDNSIKFYVERNIEKNSLFYRKRNQFILNNNFFKESHEVIFRSLTEIIKIIGDKYYPVRGKSVDAMILRIKSNDLTKTTLGGCYIEKIKQSILISKEI